MSVRTGGAGVVGIQSSSLGPFLVHTSLNLPTSVALGQLWEWGLMPRCWAQQNTSTKKKRGPPEGPGPAAESAPT